MTGSPGATSRFPPTPLNYNMGSSAVSPSTSVLYSHRRHHRPAHKLPSILRPLAPARSLNPAVRIALPAVAPDPARLYRRPRSASAAMASKAADAGVANGKQDLRVFESEEELSASLAKYTAELSERFARERGAFTVVVSGGSLIKSLRKMVESPYVDTIDWSKWHVFWVDERVVPKDHPESNYKLAYDGFLSKVPIPPDQIYAINDVLSAEGAADDYETCLKQLVKTGVLELSKATGFPKFDLMLLGMGPDGHLASLFPGHPLLHESKRWVTFINDSPKPPPERITFTFPIINSSAYMALVVTGAGKAGAVHHALAGDSNSNDLLPVQLVKLVEGEFTWFTDKAAVSKLQNKAGL